MHFRSICGDFPQVEALQEEEIKRVEEQTVLVALREFSLQLGEVGAAVFNDHYLPSNIARSTEMSNAPATTENRFVQSSPVRV